GSCSSDPQSSIGHLQSTSDAGGGPVQIRCTASIPPQIRPATASPLRLLGPLGPPPPQPRCCAAHHRRRLVRRRKSSASDSDGFASDLKTRGTELLQNKQPDVHTPPIPSHAQCQGCVFLFLHSKLRFYCSPS
uniref:Uncharacterized protein n=1 Tax=Aegilops tauschii subsp. strangulata TaxID=200361 RepID=A0A453GID4_AEGTS